MATQILEKLNKGWDWILWWRINREVLSEQVADYDALTITKSARGICFLLLLFSAVFTAAIAARVGVSMWAFADIAMMFVLGFLIYKGQYWAIVATMALWTLDKIAQIFVPLSHGSVMTVAVTLIWWAVYMHAFYLAWQVEKTRRGLSAPTAAA